MAYTLNSAKDSLGNEDQFLATFTANQRAIEDYKRRNGGDYERAFQAVTGTPWPEGRSVKVKNGVPEMTKDRTVKSVLGKYVLPIAAGVAAPYVYGALAGGGAVAGGGAAATTGSTGGGLLPSTGMIGGSVLPSGASVGLGAGGGSSLFSGLVQGVGKGDLLDMGTKIGGALIGAKAAGSAADKQLEAANRALALQEEMFSKQSQLDELNRKQEYDRFTQGRSDLAPYRGLGQNAVGTLSSLMGFQAPAPETPIPYAPGPTIGAQPKPGGLASMSPTMSTPAAPMASVTMRTPDGRSVMIPQEKVAEATQRGAQRI